MRSRGMEGFVLLVILCNCICLAMSSNQPGFESTRTAKALRQADYFFSAVFALEMVIKVIAMGLAFAPGTYIRDGFNVLDASVVLLGFINFIPTVGNYTAIRALRVLRPLRTVVKIRGLKRLVTALLMSLPLLLDVMLLFGLLMFVYGIAAVQVFGGAFRRHCATLEVVDAAVIAAAAPHEDVTSAVRWVVADNAWDEFCSGPLVTRDARWLNANGTLVPDSAPTHGDGRQCPPWQYCIDTRINPSFGISSFDNIGAAWLNIFITITMDGWTALLYQLQQGVSPYVWPFFISLIAFGPLFLVNLTLAVLYSNFRANHEAISAADDFPKDGNLTMHNVLSARYGDGARVRRNESSSSSSESGIQEEEEEEAEQQQQQKEEEEQTVGAEAQSSHPESSVHHDPSDILSRDALNALRAKLMNPSDPINEARQSLARIDSDFARVAGKPMAASSTIKMLPVMMKEQGSGSRSRVSFPQDGNPAAFAHAAPPRPLRRREHTLVRIIRLYSYHILALPSFDATMILLILFNSIIMAAQHAGQPALYSRMSDVVNYIVTICFIFEVVLKHIAYGFRAFWSNGYDAFDGLVTIASVLDIVISSSLTASGSGSALGVLRALRLIRLFRLAKHWKELQRILDTIFRALGSILYTFALLFLFLFVYALLGMQLYGSRLQFCDDVPGSVQKCAPDGHCPRYRDCWLPCREGEVDTWLLPGRGSAYYGMAYCERFPAVNGTAQDDEYWMNVGPPYVPRFNFDSFFWSLVTVFVCLVQDGWADTMYDCMRSCGYANVIYFVFLMLIGMYILLSLFLAIILEGFSAARDEDVQRDIERGRLAVLGHRFSSFKANAQRQVARMMRILARAKSTVIPIPLPEGEGEARSTSRLSWSARLGRFAWWRSRAPVEDEARSNNNNNNNNRGLFASLFLPYKGQVGGGHHAASQALDGWSLLLFSPRNRLRRACAAMVLHPYFELVIITIIVASSLALSLDHPLLHPHSAMALRLRRLDTFFLVAFTLELVLKVITYGFVVPKQAYLRNPWNWLDMAIVIIAFLIETLSAQRSIRYLRALRTFRALRPLRMLTWNPGMKIVVQAMLQSIPPLGDVLVVCFLVYFAFGVLGVNLLSGKLGQCVDATPGSLTYEQPIDPALIYGSKIPLSRDWCEEMGGLHTLTSFPYHAAKNLTLPHSIHLVTRWQNSPINFDNIGHALLALYQIASLELWEDVMLLGVDARTDNVLDGGSARDANPFMAIYFGAAVLTISFFFMNLVVGVVIDKYNEMKQRHEGDGVLLTEEQNRWLKIHKIMGMAAPRRAFTKPKSPLRARLFDIVFSPRFETCIIVIILLNTFQMAVDHYDSSLALIQALSAFNIFFTGIFVLEVGAKMFAVGPKWFFRDRMLIFDLLVVLVSIGTILGDYANGAASKQGAGAGINLVRVARLARILRLLPKAKGLHNLVQTLFFSIPALLNVGSVLFLFVFVYAIMGMQLFGANLQGNFLTEQANFRTLPSSLLMLFRTLTGENWPGVMHDAAGDYTLQSTHCIQMVRNCSVPECRATLTEGLFYTLDAVNAAHVPHDAVIDRCPPPRAASIIFFFSFTLLCGYLLLNLIIAIILDNFDWVLSEEALPVRRAHLQLFVDAWAQFDPFGTGTMLTRHLPRLIALLEAPMGVRGTNNDTLPHIQLIILSSDIPNRGGKITFSETLHALSARIAGTDLPPAARKRLEDELAGLIPPSASAESTAAHYHAAMIFKAAVRGMLTRTNISTRFSMNRNESSNVILPGEDDLTVLPSAAPDVEPAATAMPPPQTTTKGNRTLLPTVSMSSKGKKGKKKTTTTKKNVPKKERVEHFPAGAIVPVVDEKEEEEKEEEEKEEEEEHQQDITR